MVWYGLVGFLLAWFGWIWFGLVFFGLVGLGLVVFFFEFGLVWFS